MSDPEREREREREKKNHLCGYLWLKVSKTEQTLLDLEKRHTRSVICCVKSFSKEIVNSDIIYSPSYCYTNPYDLLSSVKLKQRASNKGLFWGEAFL